MTTVLHIFPDDLPQSEETARTVAGMLEGGDEITIHSETEASSPWMRVLAANAVGTVAELRRMGVRVEVLTDRD